MSQSIFKSDIDFSSVCYGQATKTKDGKYFIPIWFANESSPSSTILFQLSKISFASPLINTDSQSLNNHIDVLISHDNVDLINMCDDQILKAAKDNKSNWFPNADLSDGYFDQAHMRSLKPVTKSMFQSFKLRTHKNLKCYNSNREVITPQDADIQRTGTMLIQLYGIWFTKSRFGITWRLQQVKVPSIKQPISTCMIDEDSDSDIDNVFPDD